MQTRATEGHSFCVPQRQEKHQMFSTHPYLLAKYFATKNRQCPMHEIAPSYITCQLKTKKFPLPPTVYAVNPLTFTMLHILFILLQAITEVHWDDVKILFECKCLQTMIRALLDTWRPGTVLLMGEQSSFPLLRHLCFDGSHYQSCLQKGCVAFVLSSDKTWPYVHQSVQYCLHSFE